MKIVRYKMVCPKCGRTYENQELMSYNSRMADAAQDFVENNKPFTHCEKCHIKLVGESLVKYFDKKGNFAFNTKEVKLPPEKEFAFYVEGLNILTEICVCLDPAEILLDGLVEAVKKKDKPDPEAVKRGTAETHDLLNHILVSVKTKSKTYPIFDIVVARTEYKMIGDRYNSFLVEYYSQTNAAALNILESALKVDLTPHFKKLKFVAKQKIEFDKRLRSYALTMKY